MFYKGGEVISDQFEHFIIIQRWHPLSPWSDAKIKYGIFLTLSENGGGVNPCQKTLWFFTVQYGPIRGEYKKRDFFWHCQKMGGSTHVKSQENLTYSTGERVKVKKTVKFKCSYVSGNTRTIVEWVNFQGERSWKTQPSPIQEDKAL